jgi:hypothetical protein
MFCIGKKMPLGILDFGDIKDITPFHIEIIQLAEALAQRKDVKKVTEYLIDMRDKYLQNIETLDYLDIYPTPNNVIKMG